MKNSNYDTVVYNLATIMSMELNSFVEYTKFSNNDKGDRS